MIHPFVIGHRRSLSLSPFNGFMLCKNKTKKSAELHPILGCNFET